jgi:hypothetical protein
MPAIETALRRRIELVNLDQVPSIPFSLVFQLPYEFSPADIGYSLTQLPIFHHVLHRQTFHTDRLVFTDQACRELVQEVLATVGYASMDTNHFKTSLISIPRTLLLFGIPLLCFRKFILVYMEEFRIADGLAIGEYNEGFQAEIGTDGFLSDRRSGNVLFDENANEVAVGTVLSNGDAGGINAFWQKTRPTDIQWFFHFRKGYMASTIRECRSRIFSALAIALLLERWVRIPFLKKVKKRPVQMPQGLLCRNTRYFIKPGVFILLLQIREHRGEVFVVQSATFFVVGIRLETQTPVVCEPCTAERPSENSFLLVSRVKPKLIRSCPYVHVLHFNSYCVKIKGLKGGQRGQTYCGTSQFLPALKMLGFLAT